jgi:N-acetylmuramoyl-L-alanine amidase
MMVKFHGNEPFHKSYDERRTTNYIVIHCAATPPEMDIGLQEIRQWHVAKGWYDVGYHYIIRRDGSVENGRPHYAMGAHVKGYNQESLGICLVGGIKNLKENGGNRISDNNFTISQMLTLPTLIEMVAALYPTAKVVGHRDLDNKKDCPSFDVHQWLDAHKQLLKEQK